MLPKADSGGFVLLLFILTVTDPSRTGKGVALINAFAAVCAGQGLQLCLCSVMRRMNRR